MEGRIVRGIGGFYYVQSGDAEYTCRGRGKVRREGDKPAVGDYVSFSPGYGDELGAIEEILPRRNLLPRPYAANIDLLLAVVSASTPEPDLLLIDKLLVGARIRRMDSILIVNKCDTAGEDAVSLLTGQYKQAVLSVLSTSAYEGRGIEALKELIGDRTCCFAGQSGVGKSSLLNALHPTLKLETGGLSAKTDRGRHTTRQAELLPVGDGKVVDTPGFSLLDLDAMDPALLREYYPEFQPYRDSCRFNGCVHLREPGCAVTEAVNDGLIPTQRWERYRVLMTELSDKWRHRYD